MKQRGMLLIEMIVAGVMLLTLTAVCVRYFAVTAEHRRALDQRQTALQEASNIMERLAARPLDEITPDTLSKISLSTETQQTLPDGELKIELADDIVMQPSRPPENATKQPEGASERPAPQKTTDNIKIPTAKRITVTVRWQDQNGQWAQPVRLVAWRHQP